MSSQFFSRIAKAFFAISLATVTTTASAQVLRNGDAVIACKPNDGVTLGVKNIAELGRLWTDPTNRGDREWSSETPTVWMWTPGDFGGLPVFATSIDSRDGTIYTVTTSLYNHDHQSAATRVYRIDATTGAPGVFATLPGNAGGGYLEIDEMNNQLFVVDMDSGQIARLDLASGAILSTYDPMSPDAGPAGAYPALGERLLGMTYNPVENRVYYSVWSDDASETGNPNTIRSVGLTGDGDFNPSDDRLEISVPAENYDGNLFSMPVGDIEFDDAGTRVLLAETGFDSSIPRIRAHRARVLEYAGSTGAWTISGGTTKYEAGTLYNGQNSRGGADWAFEGIVSPEGGVYKDEQYVVFTMDGYSINDYVPPNDIYGFQFYSDSGGKSVTDSIVVDVDGDTTSQDKSVYGDFDVFHKPLPVLPYDLALRKKLYHTQAATEAGANAQFMIEVINQSSENSGSFTVSDFIPSGLSYVSATGDNFSCTNAGQSVNCDYTASLVPGEVAKFILTVRVDDITLAPFRNWAEISADSGTDIDSTPASHNASDTIPGTGSAGSDPIVNHNDLDHYDPNNDKTVDEDDSDYEDLVLGTYDLAITKERLWSSDAVSQWNSAFYIIKTHNQGTIASGDYSFREFIPAGMEFSTYQGDGFTCVDSSGTTLAPDTSLGIAGPDYVDCTPRQPILPGEYDYERFTLKVVDASMAPFRNWVEIETDSGNDVDSTPGTHDAIDDGPGTGTAGNDNVINHNDINHSGEDYDEKSEDDDDSDYEDVDVARYDLALIKKLANGQSSTVAAGDTVNYVINVINQGNIDADSFSVVDQIPAGMSFVSATSADANCSAAGSVVTCTNTSTLRNACSTSEGGCPESGKTTMVTINLALKVTDASMAPFRNWAEIQSDDGNDADSTPGSNNGNDSTSGDGGFGADNVINHNNIDHVGGDYDEASEDEDDSDYEDVTTTVVATTYDLALIKEITAQSATPAAQGTDVTYTITVRNQSNVNSGAFTVTDTMPAGMTFVSASAAMATTGITAPAAGGTGPVVFSVPASAEIAPAQQTTFEVTLRIADASNSPFRNSAEITADSGDDEDSNTGNNSGLSDTIDDHDVTTDVDPGDEDDSDFAVIEVATPGVYDLALIKQAASISPSPAAANSDVTYRILVRNQGTMDSGTFTVTDTIPAGMTFVSASADIAATVINAPAPGGTGNVTWTVPAAAQIAGSTQTGFTLILKIADTAQAPFHNIAQITADDGDDKDSNPGDNSGVIDTYDDQDVTNDSDPGDSDDSDFADVAVSSVNYDLALVKTLSAGQAPWVDASALVNYDVLIKNQGDVPSLGFSVKDVVPSGMRFISAGGTGFSCTHDGAATGGIATCVYTPATPSDLAPGATVLLNVTLRVIDVTQASFVNWAEISADSAATYGVTDSDSDPGDHNAVDNGPGSGTLGSDPSIDHNDIDHSGEDYDSRTEDEDDSDPAIIHASTTTPVTLQSFLATNTGNGRASFRFTTSMEEANVGFHIYGRIANRWRKLTRDMIVAKDSPVGSEYEIDLATGNATEYALADIDVFGKETPHGPFAPGRTFGQDPRNVQPIVREAASLGAETQTAADMLSVELSEDSAYLYVRNEGVQRVSFEELQTAGIDLSGVAVNSLALTYDDQPVPLYIGDASGQLVTGGTMRAGYTIEFLAQVSETRYRRYASYMLRSDGTDAARAVIGSPISASGYAGFTKRSATWAPNKVYSRVSPLDDPWYARRLTSLRNPSTETVNLSLNDFFARSPRTAKITVTVWGGTDDPAAEFDHRVLVRVNGRHVIAKNFGGIQVQTLTAELPAGVLRAGNNVIEVTNTNAGGADVTSVGLESVTVEYPAVTALTQGQGEFLGAGAGYSVTGVPSRDAVVWRVEGDTVTRIRPRTIRQNARAANGSVQFVAQFAGSTDANARSVLAVGAGIHKPVIAPAPVAGDLVSGPAEYLIIAHPALMGSWLDVLANAREADGLSVKTVNVMSIYRANSSGNVDANAIRDYIAWAHENLGTRYVLLVGGDTYDYKNYLPAELRGTAMSLIPTLYRASVEEINHAPADPLYGDIDGDMVPEIAIGRFPVQTQAELKAIVEKTMQYAQADYAGRTLFASDDIDDGSRRSFANDAAQLARNMEGDYTHQQISVEKLGAARVRNRVINGVRQGAALTAWVGHSDYNTWSFDRALSKEDVLQLGNTGKPTIVTQFGCWNSNFVDPKRQTMAHYWLLDENQGAAAVLGASTLTDATAEMLLGDTLLKIMSEQDVTLGQALLEAKRDMAAKYPMKYVRDIMSGYLMLGDPAIRVHAR